MLINYFLFIEILKLIERNERPREEKAPTGRKQRILSKEKQRSNTTRIGHGYLVSLVIQHSTHDSY